MAITASERTEILELVVLMFDAAPGAAYLAQIVSAYEAAGHDLAALADILAGTPAFAAVHPTFETADEFAARFLATVGLQDDATAHDWVVAQFDGGASKAEIAYAAWDILAHVDAAYGPQYQAAKAMLENKAAVSAFYSVTLGASSSNIAQLQDVVHGVTADPASADAAIHDLTGDAAQGPQLTTGLDNLQILGSAYTVIAGLVDGDADGNTASATYSAGDRIRGNGRTDLELTVIEGGKAGFVRLDNVQNVNFIAGTDAAVTLSAAGWTGVGSVRIGDGVNGMDALIQNLSAGTSIGIAGVTGSIAADYRTADGKVHAELRNALSHGTGGTLVLDADGDLRVQMGNKVSAVVSNDTGASLGEVSVSGGDKGAFELHLGGGTDPSVGNIDVAMGNDASVTLSFTSVSGDLTVGDIAVAAGDDSGLAVRFEAVGEDHALVVGDIDLSAGDSSGLFVSGEDFVDASLGNIALTGGDESMGTIQLDGFGEDSAVTAGDLSITLVGDSAARIALSAGDVSVGDARMQAGDDGYADFTAWGWNDISAGDIAQSVGDDGTANVWVTAGGDIDLGKVTQQAGDESWVGAFVGSHGDLSNLAAGGYEGHAGDSSSVMVSIQHTAGKVGGTVIGDLSASAGGDSSVTLNAMVGGEDSPTDESSAATAGDFTVGDIHASVGDVTSLDSGASVTATLLYAGMGEDSELGNITIGDVHLSVGDGFVSSTHQNMASALFAAGGISSGSLGDGRFGDVTLEGGDFARLSAIYGGAVLGAEGGTIGNGRFGDLTMRAGEAASMLGVVAWGGLAASTVGDMEVGSVQVRAQQDSNVMLMMGHGAFGGTAANFGSLTVGNVDIELGDNSHANVAVFDRAAYDGLETDANGDFAVGDIHIAVSATSTADLSGGSSIGVWLQRQVHGMDNADGGALSVGDVDLSAGADSGVSFGLSYTGTMASMGDVSIGGVSLTVGDDSMASATIRLGNSGGRMGAVDLGDASLQLGEGAAGSYNAEIGADGNVGAIRIGALMLDAGRDAHVDAGVAVSGAKIGGTTIGNSSVSVGDGATASVVYRIEGSDIGSTLVGDIHIGVTDGGADEDADVGGSVQYHVSAMGDGNDHLKVGSISIDVGGTADDDKVLVSLLSTGNVTVGNLTVSGEGQFSFHAADAALANTSALAISAGGTTTIGNVDFRGYTSDANIDLSWTTSGAASIWGGTGDDTILGNAGANVIAGGQGVDLIDISQSGNDTLSFAKGDSGTTVAAIDTIVGFTAGTLVSGALTGGDKLAFNLVAGSAGNYVERAEDFASFDEFLQNARDALNSTVKFFVQDDGSDTYVAVNYGSGEADLVVKLAGVSDATSLQFQNFIG